ncbi:hypothetical protein AMECASPLE_005459 [Ameca splendens]|uniref:PEHE domain-containing protein n=1 Tax=Ameca splendens TaxID=208324 RepID=A0ABV0YL82_9TELE
MQHSVESMLTPPGGVFFNKPCKTRNGQPTICACAVVGVLKQVLRREHEDILKSHSSCGQAIASTWEVGVALQDERREILSRSKDLDRSFMTSKVALAATAPETVQGDKPVGITSPVRPMGGEGTPVKGKWRNIRKTPASPHAQANCLRQILLLQLDLIEQQQQQLQSKDKEIDELKADKETLLARIERMERRLQLTRKDTPRDKRLFQPLEPWTPDKEDMWDLDIEESPQPNAATPLSFSRGGKGQKRKSCFGDAKVQKSRGKSAKLSPQKSEMEPGSPNQRELRSKETPEKSVPARSGSEMDVLLPCKEEPELSCQMEDLPFMSTTEMYLCCWNQPPLSPLRETSPKKEEEVAIPSWRENHIEPLDEDVCNLPEPLDDGAFLKRHAKLELDEKRRKRWDIQRIREQRMFQRLQQRMNRKKIVQETEPELSSFYPDTEDVEAIVITPFLPVVAFGRPLPRLSQQNFELPWLDERSRCRIEVPKKHTPHRTCRK